jgi:hypothetical protein
VVQASSFFEDMLRDQQYQRAKIKAECQMQNPTDELFGHTRFMKVDPMLYESQFFHFLDWVVSQYGLYLFMSFVYLCPFIIWWVHRWAKKHPEANVRPNILIYWIFPPRK